MIISETVKSGIVVETRGKQAWVKIACDNEACGGCHISGMCSAKNYTPTLPAVIDGELNVKSGDNVMVMGRVKGWLKGWILLAGMPCITILLGLIAGSMLELKDGAAGALALGSVVFYYIALWLMRKRVDKNVEWVIESITQQGKKIT